MQLCEAGGRVWGEGGGERLDSFYTYTKLHQLQRSSVTLEALLGQTRLGPLESIASGVSCGARSSRANAPGCTSHGQLTAAP